MLPVTSGGVLLLDDLGGPAQRGLVTMSGGQGGRAPVNIHQLPPTTTTTASRSKGNFSIAAIMGHVVATQHPHQPPSGITQTR